MDLLNYKWFILGAILGIMQFSWILYRGKREIPGPGQFLIYGAILGALDRVLWGLKRSCALSTLLPLLASARTGRKKTTCGTRSRTSVLR